MATVTNLKPVPNTGLNGSEFTISGPDSGRMLDDLMSVLAERGYFLERRGVSNHYKVKRIPAWLCEVVRITTNDAAT